MLLKFFLLISLFFVPGTAASEWQPLRRVILPEGPHLAFKRDTRSELVMVGIHIPMPKSPGVPQGAGRVLAELIKRQEKLEMAPLSGLPLYNFMALPRTDRLSISFQVLRDDVAEVLPVALDQIFHPVISEELLAKADSNVREQANRRSKQRAQMFHIRRQVERAFLSPEYSYAAYPDAEQGLTLNVEQLKTLHQQALGSPNLSFSVTGNIRLGQAASVLRQSLKGLPSEPDVSADSLVQAEGESLAPASSGRSLMSLNFAMPESGSRYWPVMWLLEHILEIGHSGMYRKALQESGMTYLPPERLHTRGRSLFLLPWQGSRVSAGMAKNRVLGVLNLFNAKAITDEEMQLVFQRWLNQFSRNYENPLAQVNHSARWNAYGWPDLLPDEIRLKVMSVTPELVREFFSRYVNPDKAHVAGVLPSEELQTATHGVQAGLTEKSQVVIRQDMRQDQIGASVLLRLPKSEDPRLAYLALNALREAGIRFKDPRTDRLFRKLGIQVNARLIGSEVMFSFTAHSSLKDQFMRFLPHLAYGLDVDLNAVTSARQTLLSQSEQMDPMERAIVGLYEKVTPRDIGSYAGGLNYQSTAFEDVDVLQWLEANLRESRVIYSLVGPLDPDWVIQDLRKRLKLEEFVLVEREEVPPPVPFLELVSAETGTEWVVRHDKDQFAVSKLAYYNDAEVRLRDVAAMVVIVLRFARSIQEIRKSVPDADISINANSTPHTRIFMGIAGPARQEQKILKTVNEYLRTASQFDSEETLKTFRKYIQWAQNLEQLLSDVKAGNIALTTLYGQDMDLADELVEELEKLTADDVARVYEKYFQWQYTYRILPQAQ